jgi:hypothetical protein
MAGLAELCSDGRLGARGVIAPQLTWAVAIVGASANIDQMRTAAAAGHPKPRGTENRRTA